MKAETAVAADVMSSPVHVLSGEMDVREAMAVFEEHGISGAPVVDDEGRLVGVLSQTDVVHWYLGRDDELVVDTDYWHRPHLGPSRLPGGFAVVDTNVATVAELMTPVVVTAREDTPVGQLARTMAERHVHRVILTGRGEVVAGVVSALDLLKIFAA